MKKLIALITKEAGFLLKIWKKFSELLGWINFRIIFSVIYLIMFGIYNLATLPFARWSRRRVPPTATYWRNKKYQPPTPELLERQF